MSERKCPREIWHAKALQGGGAFALGRVPEDLSGLAARYMATSAGVVFLPRADVQKVKVVNGAFCQ